MIVLPPATDSSSSAPRPTIADVARAAGVSTAVVSYALNGRPGVSAATRERVLRVADEFGWQPSAAARSVRSGPRAVGLAVSGEPGSFARAPGFLDFVTAAGTVLATRGLSLSLQVVVGSEAAGAYRQWWAERRFDVVIVPDALREDPRVEVLRRVHAPTVVLGTLEAAEGLGCAWFDEVEAADRLAAYLVALGHQCVAAVTAPEALQQVSHRRTALERAMTERGGSLLHRPTGATAEEAASVTRALLTEADRPSAIVYDTDQMALAGLDVARRCGLSVPWDVSIVAATDSELCRLATPALTTLPGPMPELGEAAAAAVLAVLDGDTEARRPVRRSGLLVRGSTGPPASGSS